MYIYHVGTCEMTQCTQQNPLTDDMLLTAINDEAAAAVITHLAACESCRSRYEEMLQVETMLQQGLFRLECPSTRQLMDYAEGNRSRSIQQHLAHCPHCRQEIADYREFMGDSADVPLSTLPELLSLTIYKLQPVTRNAPVLRGASATPIIHQATEGTRLYLDLKQRGSRWLVVGQLESDDLDTWHRSLVVVRQENIIRATGVNDMGQFSVVVPKDTDTPFQFRITRSDRVVLLLNRVTLERTG
jgi:hypothetical protein